MNWRRGARYGAAAIGLACAVALFLLYRPREAVPPAPIPTLPYADPDASESTSAGRMIYNGARGDLVVEYKARNTFPDGRTRFEMTHVASQDGRFELWADRIETLGSSRPGVMPTQFNISGHIRFSGGSGLALETETAVYDDKTGVVTMPGPVTFTRGRLSGTSTGAEYIRDEERIRLLADAIAKIAPSDDGGGGVEMTAASMVMLRALHSVHLEQDARITSDRQRLAGNSGTIVFTDDEQAMRFIELRGDASVVPIDTTATDTADMRADDITLAFHPDGSSLQHATLTGQARLALADAAGRRMVQGSWIDFFMAPDGRTLTRLDARDRVVVDLPASKTAPARLIRATTLTATGKEPKGLERARFDGDVIFEEREAGRAATEPPGRTGRAQSLVLQLDGALESVRVADFRGGVEFVDGTAQARADRAQYDVRTGMLHLTPSSDAARLPWVRDEGIELSGRDVQLTTSAGDSSKRHDLTAKGSVTTRLFPKPGARATAALFDADRDINGAAEEVVYTSATRQVIYRGTEATPAQVFQDANRITGVRIALDEGSGNLEAEGRVESSLQAGSARDAKGDADRAARPYQITGDRLVYEEKSRSAVYTGSPARLRDGAREVEAGRLVLGLGKDGRSMDALKATGDMVARLENDVELAGDSLEYVAATGRYIVRGAPAIAKHRPQGEKLCAVVKVSEVHADTKGYMEGFGSLRESVRVSCDTPIRSIRRP